tara:strand:- start:1257 stop:1811 length:555 start_codon:yes stop_codon:yes gene_type:complete
MKIVSGKYGGRRLIVPKNRDIRPTTDKVRGAVFNMLLSRGAVQDVRVLDAFCGSGALGLEALSRGAAHCTFVDRARVSIDLARENAAALNALDDCAFSVRDSLKGMVKQQDSEAYGLVFLDPPYHKDLIGAALEPLVSGGWLADEAWIVCESEKQFVLPTIEGIIPDQEKTYGDIKITLAAFNR